MHGAHAGDGRGERGAWRMYLHAMHAPLITTGHWQVPHPVQHVQWEGNNPPCPLCWSTWRAQRMRTHAAPTTCTHLHARRASCVCDVPADQAGSIWLRAPLRGGAWLVSSWVIARAHRLPWTRCEGASLSRTWSHGGGCTATARLRLGVDLRLKQHEVVVSTCMCACMRPGRSPSDVIVTAR
jgi:hypothetical protein